VILVLLAVLTSHPVQAGSDGDRLGARLAEAGISVPPTPFLAPPFSMADLAGGTVELPRLRGQVVLLYFWTTW